MTGRGNAGDNGTRALLIGVCAFCDGPMSWSELSREARCGVCRRGVSRTPMRGVLRFRNGRAYGYAFTRRTCAHNGSAHYAREGATTRIPGGYKVRGAPRSPIGVRTNIIDVDASTYAPDGSIVRARYVRGAIANTLRVTPNAADRFIARYNAERTYGQA